MKTAEEEKKKKSLFVQKKAIAKLQMTGASQRASRAVTRERQNSNKQSSVYLLTFPCIWAFSALASWCMLTG